LIPRGGTRQYPTVKNIWSIRQQLDELKGKVEEMRPAKPYPNASNNYRRELDEEERREDKILSNILTIIDSMK